MSFFDSIDFQEWAADLMGDRGPCTFREGGGCKRCGVCCTICPGSLEKDDVPRIAEHLGITVQELVSKYLTLHDNAGYLVPMPLRKGQTCGGLYLPSRETWHKEPCVFLIGTANACIECSCSIYSVRPFQCRQGYHADEDVRHPGRISEDELRQMGFRTFCEDTDWEEDEEDDEER